MNGCIRRIVLAGLLAGVMGCSPRIREKDGRMPDDVSAPPSLPPTQVAVPDLMNPGHTIDLDAYRGKVVLLDFWATWCSPCRVELPALNRLYNDLKDKDFSIIGMTVDQAAAERVADSVRRLNPEYPVGLAGPEIQKAFGGIRAVPTKILLDRQGNIRERYLGVVPEQKLRSDIEKLLAAPAR